MHSMQGAGKSKGFWGLRLRLCWFTNGNFVHFPVRLYLFVCVHVCLSMCVCVCVWKTLPVCLCLSNLLQPSRRHLPRSKTKAASTNFSNMWITWSTVLHIAYLSNFFSSSHPILVATAGFPPALGSSLSASFSNCFWLKFKQKCVACTCQQQQKGRA